MLALFLLPAGTDLCIAQSALSDAETQSVVNDQSIIKVQPVPEKKIDDFRNDNAFNYMMIEKSGFDFWSLFWYWFNKILAMFFSDKGIAPFIRYLLIFLVVAFIIYKIAGGNLSGIFSSNKKSVSANGFDYFEEDIHQIDLDKKLRESIHDKKFRHAIRFYYLILLKKLDAVELIYWQPGKTNRDYQRELQSKSVLDDFIKLSGIYEYSWYGNFEVSETQFIRWQLGFNEVLQNINNK
ncbi:MAG: DUF4129 domain-containing protein [Bacteroidales bacterium]|nr:DUF4129 domain-containing protein [Bacteroidales bacterium]